MFTDRIDRTFAQQANAPRCVDVNATHSGLRCERHGCHARPMGNGCAFTELLVDKRYDASDFWGFVGAGGEPCGLSQFDNCYAWRCYERRRLTIAKRNGAGFVEKQYVHIPRCLNGATGSSNHVRLHHAAHAGHTNRGEQTANGRRDQTDQQRDQYGDGDWRASFGCGNAKQRKRKQRDGASRNTIVNATNKIVRAISFSVF